MKIPLFCWMACGALLLACGPSAAERDEVGGSNEGGLKLDSDTSPPERISEYRIRLDDVGYGETLSLTGGNSSARAVLHVYPTRPEDVAVEAGVPITVFFSNDKLGSLAWSAASIELHARLGEQHLPSQTVRRRENGGWGPVMPATLNVPRTFSGPLEVWFELRHESGRTVGWWSREGSNYRFRIVSPEPSGTVIHEEGAPAKVDGTLRGGQLLRVRYDLDRLLRPLGGAGAIKVQHLTAEALISFDGAAPVRLPIHGYDWQAKQLHVFENSVTLPQGAQQVELRFRADVPPLNGYEDPEIAVFPIQ